jgi:hypothetical protein
VNSDGHIAAICEWFNGTMAAKYHRGQQEHGGKLWERRGALSDLEEELIDLAVYYKTAKDQLKQMAAEGKSAAEAYAFLYGEE